MYRGWTQRDYQNKHYNINQNDEGTLDDRVRDGGTNFILRIKEQETRLTLQKHDDGDDDMLDLTLSSSPQRYGTTQPRGLHCAASCFGKTMRNNVDTVAIGTSGMRVKCVRYCWLSAFERRQFAVLQVKFVIRIQKNHLTLMENILRGKLCTKFQIYTMCFVQVTSLLVFHVVSIHHRSLSHCVLSNHMRYPEERTFSIPQHNFVFSKPVYKPCVIIQGLAIRYYTNSFIIV